MRERIMYKYYVTVRKKGEDQKTYDFDDIDLEKSFVLMVIEDMVYGDHDVISVKYGDECTVYKIKHKGEIRVISRSVMKCMI